MSVWTASPHTHRLVVLEDQDPLGGHRVAVDAAAGRDPFPAALRLGDGRTIGVAVHPDPVVPPAFLAVGDRFAREVDLAQGDWTMTAETATAVHAVVLHNGSDQDIQDAVRTVREASDLAGQVVWRSSDPAAPCWLPLGGTPWGIRSAVDATGRELAGLIEIGQATDVSVFGQGNQVGVDVVVLADCSGSMSQDDIDGRTETATARPRASAWITRAQALKHSLDAMLASRVLLSGGVSRVGIIKFTTTTEVVFPRDGTMAELSRDSARATVEEYQHAVRQLRPEDAATDIGHAIHGASELLYRHGTPGNDKLIVLVSDGANWKPRTADSTGESVAATTDPVSLMEDLHRTVGIRLHAIGISDERLFDQWWQRVARPGQPPEDWRRPNHALLAELVAVGGGDPRHVGGLGVLQDYFERLGLGVTVAVGRPAVRTHSRLSAALAARFLDDAGSADDHAELSTVVDELERAYGRVHGKGRQGPTGRSIFDDVQMHQFAGFAKPATDRITFGGWIVAVNKVVSDHLRAEYRRATRPDDDLFEVRGLLRDGRLNKIRIVRNDYNHTTKEQKRSSVGEVLVEAIGDYYLEPDDSTGWLRLQLWVARQVRDVLVEVADALSPAAEDRASPPATPEPVTFID